MTSGLPRKGTAPVKKMASSATYCENAVRLRSAIDLAKARSAARTCSCGESGADIAKSKAVAASAIAKAIRIARRGDGRRDAAISLFTVGVFGAGGLLAGIVMPVIMALPALLPVVGNL